MSPQPIPLGKSGVIRDQRLRDDAKDQACVRCDINDGTVVSAHYTGFRQIPYGKGTGHKVHDLITAWLCLTCHQHFDQPQQRKSIEASEEFLHLVTLTNCKRFQMGMLVSVVPRKQGVYDS
jgi:hypothetical protein